MAEQASSSSTWILVDLSRVKLDPVIASYIKPDADVSRVLPLVAKAIREGRGKPIK